MTAVVIPATPSRNRTGWLLPALATAVVWLVVRWATVPYMVGVFHDDGVYLLLARSIASGGGFHYSHLVGAPAAIHYPPLYPLLLAAVWRVAPTFPGNVSLLLGLNAVLLGIAALGWWRLATSRLAWAPAMAASGAMAAMLASPMLTLASALLSEPFFVALLFPALLLSERTADSSNLWRAVATGALIGALVLVRTHGVALLIACLLVLAVRRRWRDAAAMFGAAFVVQIPWTLWSQWASPRVPAPLEGAYGSYVGWFVKGIHEGGIEFVLATARINAGEFWLLLQDRFASGMPVSMHYLTMGLAVAALLAGGWSLIRHAPVTIAFLVLYLSIVLVWPYTPWRFVWGVWPIVALLALEGTRRLWVAAGKWRVAVAVGAALPAFAFLRTELHAYATRSWRAPAHQSTAQIAPALQWVRAHTTPNDIVLTEGEQVMALYAGRLAAPNISFTALEYVKPDTPDQQRARLEAMIAAVPARYLITVSPALQRAAREMAAAPSPVLHVTDSSGTIAVFEVTR
jgi:hypothetical protein